MSSATQSPEVIHQLKHKKVEHNDGIVSEIWTKILYDPTKQKV